MSFTILISDMSIQDTLLDQDNSSFKMQEKGGLQDPLIKEGVSSAHPTPNLSPVSLSLSLFLPDLLTHSINIGHHAATLSSPLHNMYKF
jgi:hypothetical protein